MEWFHISGCTEFGQEIRKSALKDPYGNTICGCRMKMETINIAEIERGRSIDITIKDPGQNRIVVLATITNPKIWGCCSEQSVDIFIHSPPVSILDVTTSGKPATIHVEGNIDRKKYCFMVGNLETKPYKIAQVNKHSIEIGANIDIAFICFSAYAIEKMFSASRDPNATGWVA